MPICVFHHFELWVHSHRQYIFKDHYGPIVDIFFLGWKKKIKKFPPILLQPEVNGGPGVHQHQHAETQDFFQIAIDKMELPQPPDGKDFLEILLIRSKE